MKLNPFCINSLFLIFVLLTTGLVSCSRRDEIKPIVKKSDIFKKKTKKVIMRYALTPDEVGSFQFKDVSGVSPKHLKKVVNIFKNFKFKLGQLGMKWFKMGKVKISTDLKIPTFEQDYLHGVSLKRVVLALIPCEKKSCGIRGKFLTHQFIQSGFLSLSLENSRPENKAKKFKATKKEIKKIKRKERKQRKNKKKKKKDDHEDSYDITKVPSSVFLSKSNQAKDMIELSHMERFPLDIFRQSRDKDSPKEFFLAHFNKYKPLFKHNQNIFILSNYKKADELIHELSDYFLTFENSLEMKFYKVGKQIFLEAKKDMVSDAKVKNEVLDALNFIKEHRPEVLNHRLQEFTGADLINCQKKQCILFDVLNAEFLPLLKSNQKLKIDTYLHLNQIPKTDFIYVGFIEFEANIEIDLEI